MARSVVRPSAASVPASATASTATAGVTPVPSALPASTAPPAMAAVARASLGGSDAPMFTAPSQSSSSGGPSRRPPGRSPRANPTMGASATGRESMAWRKPLRSTAASPATTATTR